jgi:hypothetical protein
MLQNKTRKSICYTNEKIGKKIIFIIEEAVRKTNLCILNDDDQKKGRKILTNLGYDRKNLSCGNVNNSRDNLSWCNSSILDRRNETEMMAGAEKSIFLRCRFPFLEDEVFREFRSPRDSSQFKIKIQFNISNNSEVADYDDYCPTIKNTDKFEEDVYCKDVDRHEDNFKVFKREKQNAWILFCKASVSFEDLKLPGNFVYTNNNRRCKNGDRFGPGMSIIRYTGRLLGGVRHFIDRQFSCFAIFSSIDKSFDIVKIDLIGYELDNAK